MSNVPASFFERVCGGLIVSCQALPGEPLHGPQIMARMALAAEQGGAVGIRANTAEDIREIQRTVRLPVIGIIKKSYPDYPDVYITPSMHEIDRLAECGVDVIAMDATHRIRHGGRTLADLFCEARRKYPRQLFMADCSCAEEGMDAAAMGFDLIATTLAGYTPRSAQIPLPPFEMIEYLARHAGKPVVAEGHIWTPEDLRRAISAGALAAVVGTAITRPREITRRFADALKHF